MAFFDLPLDALKTYCPPREEPADFDAFWAKTLAETRAYPLDPHFEQVDYGLRRLRASALDPCLVWSNTSAMAAGGVSLLNGFCGATLVLRI